MENLDKNHLEKNESVSILDEDTLRSSLQYLELAGKGNKNNKQINRKRKAREDIPLSQKPKKPYKEYISPSSLYKLRCPRCLWLMYHHNFQLPANLALQQKLSRLQEAFFNEKETNLVSDMLKPGVIRLSKGHKKSKMIQLNGAETAWYFKGELDFVVHYDDGTFGIADGKVSMKNEASSLALDYFPQLQAYTYMLENPADPDEMPIKISDIGLIRWKIDSTNSEGPWGFSVMHEYIPVERDDMKFENIMEEFIGIIENDFPEPNSSCLECKFFSSINFNYDR